MNIFDFSNESNEQYEKQSVGVDKSITESMCIWYGYIPYPRIRPGSEEFVEMIRKIYSER